MKFGKEFRIHLEETIPEWRDKYLCYKFLKNLLKHLPNDPIVGPFTDRREYFFVTILNGELHKFNDFFVDKEEDFIIRFKYLKDRNEWAKEQGRRDGVLALESEFSQEMMDIRKDFVNIHGEMVLLKNYSSLNFTGLVKFLKKYDKRTGGLLCIPFTQLAFHQPFFRTEALTMLVHECEANLELLFPMEAEVVESTAHAQDQTNTTPADVANMSLHSLYPPGEETVDIYRSTLAAMRTIQGLKTASSSYNPLSFAFLFGSRDNDSIGSVTAENSPCNSIASQNGEEPNKDNTRCTK